MTYNSFIFDNYPNWEVVPAANISSFHWEGENPFCPPSFAQLCGVRGKGISARLWSFELDPRCVGTKRDDPVYEDSCLELFLQPVAGRPEYINFEMNSAGVYLSQFGEGRGNRIFLKDLCDFEPSISCFEVKENGETAWGVEIFISEALIGKVYSNDYILSPGEMKGNFYKCGDKTPVPHYGAYFPVGSAVSGFHNPGCFGRIILK